MSSLKEKAKTLSDLFWENELDWYKWLRLGVTEQKQIELAPKYQEKWVRLEDAQKEINEKSEGYAKVCARLHEQVIDLTMKEKDWKQKLQQLIEQFRQELSRQEVMKTFSQDNVNLAFNSFARKFEELLKEEKDAKR